MSDQPHSDPEGGPAADEGAPQRDRRNAVLDRRTVLRAAGTSAALFGTAGLAGAHRNSPGPPDDTPGQGPPDDTPGEGPPEGSPGGLDPLFGKPSAGPNPCAGDAGGDCLDAVTPVADHEVELQIDLPELLLAVGGQGLLSAQTLANVNAAAADGEVTPEELDNPDSVLSVELPGGSRERVTVREVAELLAGTVGFHFHPAGLHVEPGAVVLFSAETPDHGVAPYHERHGRQNRVPDGVGPFASPLVPVGGYWLFRFSTPGVYDCYCPPHDPFGMVLRVVVSDGDVPDPDVENTGRPPPAENLLPVVLGGPDPNLPSSMAALNTDALAPARIVDEGKVHWPAVIAEHRSSA